jgi:hypothetical protein
MDDPLNRVISDMIYGYIVSIDSVSKVFLAIFRMRLWRIDI